LAGGTGILAIDPEEATMPAERIRVWEADGPSGTTGPRRTVALPGWIPAHTHPRHGRLGLRILLLLLLVGIPLPAWSGEGGAPRLQRWYQELHDLAQRTPFGVPLRMQSEGEGT
jgi:hypothetical protein